MLPRVTDTSGSTASIPDMVRRLLFYSLFIIEMSHILLVFACFVCLNLRHSS